MVQRHIFHAHRFASYCSDTLTARAIPASEMRSNNNLSINSRVAESIIFFCECSTNCRPHSWQRNRCLPLWIRPFFTLRTEEQLGQTGIGRDRSITSSYYYSSIITFRALPLLGVETADVIGQISFIHQLFGVPA